MAVQILSLPSGHLATSMRGVWWLLSREDYTKDGQQRIDPVLGADPTGIITYADTHFAAQFMKRDRSDNQANQLSFSGENNTSAVGGYDAYFGTYEVNEQTGKVSHTLIGSITPSNIGITVLRDLRAAEDQLIIQLETTTTGGEPITRTLTWKRIG
jgi:Lipocalin-like domain